MDLTTVHEGYPKDLGMRCAWGMYTNPQRNNGQTASANCAGGDEDESDDKATVKTRAKAKAKAKTNARAKAKAKAPRGQSEKCFSGP